MKKQLLSIAIALPTVLLGAVPSLANTLTIALVKVDTPQLTVSTQLPVPKVSCSLSSGCRKKSHPQKVGSEPTPTPTPTPTNPPKPPCPLPRLC